MTAPVEEGVPFGLKLQQLAEAEPEGVGAILVALEIVVLFAGVVSRYVFHAPLTWSDELASILFLWLAMLGAVIALRRGEHMRLTAIVQRAPPGARVKTVAAALEIHPFMLTKWRKDAREGKLRGTARQAPRPGPAREIARLAALEREYVLLKEEHDLLKKAIRFCSARKATRSPSSTRTARSTR